MTIDELVRQGKHNRDEQNYEESYECFLEAAIADDPLAIKNLGEAYLYEEGVTRDFDKAFRYLKMAYDMNGDISFIYNLMVVYDEIKEDRNACEMYMDLLDYLIDHGEWSMLIVKAGEYSEDGICGEDTAKKIELYEKAVKHGLYIGAECLGEMYFLGEEVERDYEKAYQYFTGHDGFESFAKPFYLGIMYEKGMFVERDIKRALQEYKSIVNSNTPMKSGDTYYIKAGKRLRDIVKICGERI